jgi:hypothetical protein
VRSYLHFSQIRSWQEVGVTDHTHSPFRLLYRVCSSSRNRSFSPHTPLTHSFPALSLNQHSALLVSLTYLPRLPCFPAQVIHDNVTCKIARSKIKSIQRSTQKSKGQSASEDSQHSPKSVEAFPFSPPLPSPLSPKLLTGLADRPTFATPLLATDQLVAATTLASKMEGLAMNSDHVVNSDPFLDCDLMVDSDPDPVVNSDPMVERRGGGVVPPAACSPAPFSRMHTGRERGGAKRRSCAISCKVCNCGCQQEC